MIRLPAFTICAGIAMKARRNVVNSMRRIIRFSSLRASASRPPVGSDNAIHAFRLHAREPITMYAQLLTSVSTGAASAWASPLSCARRFSWLQRRLASSTICSAGVRKSLVMKKKQRVSSNSTR